MYRKDLIMFRIWNRSINTVSFCIHILYFHSVFSLCIFSLYFHSVFSFCIFILYFYSVFSFCIFILYFPSVFSFCIFIQYFHSVFSFCIFILYYLFMIYNIKYNNTIFSALDLSTIVHTSHPTNRPPPPPPPRCAYISRHFT